MKAKVIVKAQVLLAILLVNLLSGEMSCFKKTEPETLITEQNENTFQVGKEYYPEGTKGGPMVYVPQGLFYMGCNIIRFFECIYYGQEPEISSFKASPMFLVSQDTNCGLECDIDELFHEVYLDAFLIDKYEVTVINYNACVISGNCDHPSPSSYEKSLENQDNYPITGVDWVGAKSYCEYIGKRLPTEAEWEKAAKGTLENMYPWGNKWDGLKANYCDANCYWEWGDNNYNDGYEKISPVGNYPDGASPYGVMDMAGNVWEWTSDWYEEDYSKTADLNPKGPLLGEKRVIRGGSWAYLENDLRVANRDSATPDSRRSDLGFRCAKDTEK